MTLNDIPSMGLIYNFRMDLKDGCGDFWLRQRGWNGTFFLDCDVCCYETGHNGTNHMFSLDLNEEWQISWSDKEPSRLMQSLFSDRDRKQLQATLDRLYKLRAFI